MIGDLPGSYLGYATEGLIVIDLDAAGHGWFVDVTPFDNEEFNDATTNSLAAARIDLLTVVAHELGHLRGRDHSDQDVDVMATSLSPGVRHMPEDHDRRDKLESVAPTIVEDRSKLIPTYSALQWTALVRIDPRSDILFCPVDSFASESPRRHLLGSRDAAIDAVMAEEVQYGLVDLADQTLDLGIDEDELDMVLKRAKRSLELRDHRPFGIRHSAEVGAGQGHSGAR